MKPTPIPKEEKMKKSIPIVKEEETTRPTPTDIAEFMYDWVMRSHLGLYQDIIVREIQMCYGEKYLYYNKNGSLAIKPKVLSEFRKMTEGKVVWSRRGRYWRTLWDHEIFESRTVEW